MLARSRGTTPPQQEIEEIVNQTERKEFHPEPIERVGDCEEKQRVQQKQVYR